jgi:hypothetical protein
MYPRLFWILHDSPLLKRARDVFSLALSVGAAEKFLAADLPILV